MGRTAGTRCSHHATVVVRRCDDYDRDAGTSSRPSPALPPYGTAAYAHRRAGRCLEARVHRSQQPELGDPEFVQNPVDQLTSKQFTRGAVRDTETTHYHSVVDANGNAVATTTTLNALYGSGVYVRGAGFFLNDEMDDFAAQHGQPNMFGLVQGEQNAIVPGKRMLSASCVADYCHRSHRPAFPVVGARGGLPASSPAPSRSSSTRSTITWHSPTRSARRACTIRRCRTRCAWTTAGSRRRCSIRCARWAWRSRQAVRAARAPRSCAGPTKPGWCAVDPRATGGAVGY